MAGSQAASKLGDESPLPEGEGAFFLNLMAVKIEGTSLIATLFFK